MFYDMANYASLGVYAGIPDFSARLEGAAPTVVSLGAISIMTAQAINL